MQIKDNGLKILLTQIIEEIENCRNFKEIAEKIQSLKDEFDIHTDGDDDEVSNSKPNDLSDLEFV